MTDQIKNTLVFPDFPGSEYQERYDRLVAEGLRNGVDAFIFTDEENLRYFAGGPLTDAYGFRPDYIAVIIPVNTDTSPRFVLGAARINATRSSWIKEQCLWGGAGIASSGNLTVDAMVNAIHDLGLADSTVAMEISGNEKLFMPVSVYDSIRKQLPGMRIVSCSASVAGIRAVKSPLEIQCIKEACRITTEAIEYGFSTIKEDTTEKEIYRAVKSRMYQLGADKIPFLTVIAGWEGRSICWDTYPTDYAVKPGDPIQVDGGCSVKGYVSDMTRTAAFGSFSDPRYLELYGVSLRAHKKAREMLKPGVVINDVCEAGRKSIIDDGFEELLVFGEGQTGHGIGLGIHEEPFLIPGSQKILKPGMVLAIEPAVLEDPDLQKAAYFSIVENNYLITETGFEQLTNSPEEIRIL